MQRRNDLKYEGTQLKTALQWAKQGKLPNNLNGGKLLWSNAYCNQAFQYFDENEVHTATKEEMADFMKPYLEKRKAADKKRKERLKREQEEKRKWQQRKEFLLRAAKDSSIPCENNTGGIVFHLETTGLTYDDEALELSILDLEGTILFHSYLKPYIKTVWKEAEQINRISYDTVKNAPFPHEIIPIVKGMIESADILVGYHLEYELEYLSEWGIDTDGKKTFDVMKEFALIYGEQKQYDKDYQWKSLAVCADYYGFKFLKYDNLEKTKAILFCMKQMKYK